MPEDKVNLILIELKGIQTSLETALGEIGDHEDRLRELEHKGGKRWESLVGQVITLLVAGFAGWLFRGNL
ncbi:MAG: hypothetical protein VB049_07285 [Candidatus Pelethousia sp.]|nr:hypothetical protein [Candidatus Pelethousia sp.]